MATGLESFDGFGWDKVLAGRRILIVDADRKKGLARARALDEAGAATTVANFAAQALDRARTGAFDLAILAIAEGEAWGAVAQILANRQVPIVLLAKGGTDAATRHGEALMLASDISDRDLVMALGGGADE